MKVYEYNRVSTSEQEVAQQHNTVQQFIVSKGWKITESVSDEGVSGGVSYKDRNLYKLIQRMDEGDVLIVSEISRLGRSMSDLNKLVNDELKPRKLRLIIVKMGLDLDCSNLKAIDEMILFAFSFSSQIEKEMIQDRTRSALETRKQKLAQYGSFISKSGRKCTHLGASIKDLTKASEASAKARRAQAQFNEMNRRFKDLVDTLTQAYGTPKNRMDVLRFVDALNKNGITTASGMPYTVERYRAQKQKIDKLYAA